MGALDNFVALTALPAILAQFQQPNSGTFVISAYVIASTASIPIFAKLSDSLEPPKCISRGSRSFHYWFDPLGTQPEPQPAYSFPRHPGIRQWWFLPSRNRNRCSRIFSKDPRQGDWWSLRCVWHRRCRWSAHWQCHRSIHHMAMGILRKHSHGYRGHSD